MLEIGSKGEYAVRAMVYLGRRYGMGATSLTAISETQRIPRRYLEQLISQLRNAGFVRATRGAAGGYELGRHPGDIHLYEIVSLLEGPLMVHECVDSSANHCCGMKDECSVRDVWVSLHRTIHDTLMSVSIQQLIESGNQKQQANRMNGHRVGTVELSHN